MIEGTSATQRAALALTAGLLVVTSCRIGTELPNQESGALELGEAEGISAEIVRATLEATVFSPQQNLFYHAHGPLGSHPHPIGGPYVHDIEIIDGPLPSSHNLFSIDVAVDVPCSAGGTLLLEAAAVGEGNPLTQRGFIDYELGHDPTACVLLLDDGAQISLESPPYVTGEAHVSYDGSSLAEIAGLLTGGLAWEAESKAGTCELELTFEASAASVVEIVEVPVTGTFCDLTIDMTIRFD